MHTAKYWETISHNVKQIKSWMKENQIDGKVDVEDMKKVIIQAFDLER